MANIATIFDQGSSASYRSSRFFKKLASLHAEKRKATGLEMRFSSPVHFDLVVVSPPFVVIDFDDGCVIVGWVGLLNDRHLATAISLIHGHPYIRSWQRAGKISLLVDSRCPTSLSLDVTRLP